MFNQLFNRPCALERHTIAPLAEQRLRYLSHCAEQGATKPTMRRVAQAQLIQLGLKSDGKISSEQIEAAADRCVMRSSEPIGRSSAIQAVQKLVVRLS